MDRGAPMLLFLLACTTKSPPDGPAGEPDTGLLEPSTGDTGAPPTEPGPLPPGWSRVRLARSPLGAICADGATTWVVDGDGGVLRAGDPWEDLEVAPFVEQGLYSADARDGALWAISRDGLGRLDGAGWSVTALPSILQDPRALAVRGDGTVAVLAQEQPSTDCYYGCSSTVINVLGLWDGSSWTVHATDPTDGLNDLAETASGELVAVGDGGWVALWDGTGWVDLHRGEPSSLRAVDALGDEIVAVGYDGLVIRGTTASLSVSSIGGDYVSLTAVDIGEDGTVWALDYASAWVDDGGWSEVALPDGGFWLDVEATSDGALLVGGRAGPTAMAGGAGGWSVAWRQASVFWVQDIWVDSDGTAWLATYDALARWDASGLEAWETPHPVREGPGSLRAVSGSGPDDVVAAGDDGIFEWDGTSLQLVWPVEDGIVWDVSVAPDGTAFVTGSERLPDETEFPRLIRRDGGVWSVDPTPIPTAARALMEVIAFAADDVYALTWSEPVSLLHFDGAAWTELASDLGEGYGALWGRSGTDLYIGKDSRGEGPSLLHWDGVATSEVSGAPPYVTAIAGTDTALLVTATDGWGDAFGPHIAVWRDELWTELMRGDHFLAAGAAGETAVLTDSIEALKGPLASW